MDEVNTTEASRDDGYEKCLVTFVDILGFKQQIETRKAADLAENLERFRRFSGGDEEFEPRGMDEVRVQSQVRAEIISDAVARVRTTETQYQSGPFIWELLDLLHIQIECLQNEILVRGAMKYDDMHIGYGLGGPIFGKALTDAYLMEDKEVKYLVIAIDDKVIAWHQADHTAWREGHRFEDERYHLDRLLKKNDRGHWFLDYLTAAQYEVDEGQWPAFLELHRNFIMRELDVDHPESVNAKYVWMREYHNNVISSAQKDIAPEVFADDFETTWLNVFETLKVPD